ncbi:hypothetical protein X777_09976 [Ooceraea biroi]|uniref:Uncharacterized protein n=1 Tax=Ooceraea biroi TaxID=2015173 RepID=A0A026W5L8_OOCBI|nr:hypothetical protein X777_09976 [Ooceraea biroi]
MISRRVYDGRRLRDYIAVQFAHRERKNSGRARSRATKGPRLLAGRSLGYARVNQVLSGWTWDGYDGAEHGNGSSIFP